MKISPTKLYAVLTGDIVASSKLGKAERKHLPDLIKAATKETRTAFPGAVPLEIDVFRGDSWQLLVTDVRQSLRIALHLRACLKAHASAGRGIDTRVALAVGTVDFVPKRKVSEGDGPAYRRSGALLETLSRDRAMVVEPTDGEDDGIDAMVGLMDALVQQWTARQARAIAGAVCGWTQEEIAGKWPQRISQPAVTKHLSKAHWPAVERALIVFERKVDEGTGQATAMEKR